MYESKHNKYYDGPLSVGQQSLWLIHNCANDKSIYNTHFAWKIPDAVDVSVLKESLQYLVDRHPLLRTLFVETDKGPVQRVYDQAQLRFEERQIDELSDDAFSATIIDEEFKQPFNLSKETAMRWVLFSRPNNSRVLCLVFHHIIVDMGSFMIIANELRDAYNALLNGSEVDLPEIKQDYFDFIEKQNTFLETQEGKEQEDYWREELEGVDTSLDLPLDFNRPLNIECTVGYLNKFIPTEVTSKFNQFSADNKLSLFSLYISTYHLLLHAYTKNLDILVGTPTGGKVDDFNGVFGYFTNPVIVRSDIDPEMPVLDFFRKMNEKVKKAINYQAYPLSRVAEKLNLDRSVSKAALFQTSFAWQNINAFENRDEPFVTWDHSGKRLWDFGEAGIWERFNRRQQLDDLDLTFKVYKFKNDFHLGIEYNAKLFQEDTIKRMATHYQKLMRSISANPDSKISDISLVTDDEYQQIIFDWNNTEEEYDRENTFIDVFQSQVDETPTAAAINFYEQTLSYDGLNKKANQLARLLKENGVQQEVIVGISLDRSPEMIIALLGVLKAGGAYLPLDPAYPKDRLEFMIRDSQVPLVITSDAHRVVFSHIDTQIVSLDEVSRDLDTFSNDDLPKQTKSHHLAYIIYTSGSTGKPKGVQVEHASLMNLTLTQKKVFTLNQEDNVLLFSSLNFDASIFAITLALTHGAELYLAQREELLGDGLSGYLNEKNISWVLLPPSVASTLSAASLPNLKTLVVGGEACSQSFVQEWAQGRQLYNAYGPTESTVWATCSELDGEVLPPIGKPVVNTQTYILDSNLKPVPIGVPGELHVGGDGLARGYLNRPELTEKAFIVNPFSAEPNSRLYKSGDLARYLPDGNIEFLGRIDHQIKVRGFRVELGEIESTLLTHSAVDNVLVMSRNDMTGKPDGEALLAAYVITKDSQLDVSELKQFLNDQLPDYMVPSGFVLLDAFPLTPNEKIDRNALPTPKLGSGKRESSQQIPRNEIEKLIAGIWQSVLNLQNVSTDENFFDLGGHSLLLAQVFSKFPENIKKKLSMVDLFKYPTIRALAIYVGQDDEEEKFFLQQDEHVERMRLRRRMMENIRGLKIAIVGMSGRFPGAENVDEFWQNIIGKNEAIRFYSDEELLADGVPKSLIENPNYVGAKGALRNVKGFDADFFAYSPREAQITDPQHRLFLECAYEALEDAGCVPDKFRGQIGVYAGTGINNYLMNHISANQNLINAMGDYPVMIGNDKDFLSNRVSYKLNLNGPAMVIQTACSTSLVAVHTACQALINEECDAALAGGVSLGKLDKEGYLYKEGMIMSPDGHCRVFDEKAKGTVQGQGAGVVLLKRLDDALKDNDHVYAVIKGSGINNDGSAKSGYTAPSIEGQAKAIMLAQASANVSPEQVSYIEAHGTGTPLGDPIEIEGLNYAFRFGAQAQGQEPGVEINNNSCAIGSVKGNIGHMDAASGVTGLIKSAKALEQKTLPPNIHFNKANPKINFEKSPFYVNTDATPWPDLGIPRHAGVSSFGIGGTNAHIVLSEAPGKTLAGRARPWQIIALSAKTESALEVMTTQFLHYLNTHPEVNFSDICYTLHTGRKLFEYRRYLVCESVDDAILELSKTCEAATEAKDASARIVTKLDQNIPRKIAFMFSGQGSQYVNMARKLYRVELNFRRVVDHCRTILKEKFVYLFERLEEDDFSALSDKVHDTYITQPTLFIVEYALAKTLMSWNIQPEIMIGHSIGEYVAACLAGVFTLDQALELVTIRGRMIYDLEKGYMLMLELNEQEASAYLNESLSLAAINGERRCVISGQSDAIITLQKELTEKQIHNRILHTSHAFHSHMMDAILADFTRSVAKRQPRKPQIPFVSSMTGNMITDEQATSPEYWAQHLRDTVRFHRGMSTLLNSRENDDTGWILMEIGPGKVLSTLTRQHPDKHDKDVVYETMPQSDENLTDTKKLLTTLAKLWANNVDIDWHEFHSSRQRYKVPLPTYPFERLDYWVESGNKLRLSQDRRGRQEQALPPLPEQQTDKNMTERSTKPAVAEARDTTDLYICQLWEKSLGVNDIGIHDNYFDLGGDSLRAVGIVGQLVAEYKTPIATHILIQKPTVAELSDYIKSITQHPEVFDSLGDELLYTSSLVTIQKGNERKQPLFMVHPIGGEVYFYRDLAHQLGADQPLFAFQAASLSGQSEPYDDVVTLASDYISELKVIGAKPPYLLGGSSFGGLVAYEMAQQLKANGEEVRLVVMIDTPFPQEMPAHLTNSAAILNYLLKDKVKLSLETLNKLDPKAQIDYVLEEARLRGKSDMIPPHLGVPLFNTWIAHQHATFAYEPKPYEDDVVFFRHTERMEHFPAAPHETWSEYIEGKMEIHQVPGDHITMNYQPCVSVLAAHLKIVLKNTAAQIKRESDNAQENKLYPQSYTLTEST